VTRRVVATIERLGAATIVAVVVALPSGVLAQPTPSPQLSLAGNVPPNFPAAPAGRVAVATSGLPYQNVVSFVVRNGSSAPVDRLKVSVTARGPEGKVLGRGSTTTIVPSALNPNEIAIGRVRLSKPGPAGAKYEFKVSTHRLRHRAPTSTLQVATMMPSSPMVGGVAQTLTVEAHNAGRGKIRGPITVVAVCFNQANHPVQSESAKDSKAGLPAGARWSYTFGFSSLCPAYLVGARSR
jgi:hypothetical protein